MMPFEKLNTVPSNESGLEESVERKEDVATEKDAVQGWLARMKERSLYVVESAKEKVTKQTIGLALASILASTPQEAVASHQNEEYVADSAVTQNTKVLQSYEHSDIADRLNEEFAKDAQEDSERRRVEFWNGTHFKEKEQGTDLTKEIYFRALAVGTGTSREEVDAFYQENKEDLDKKLEPLSFKKDDKARSAVAIGPSGVMFTFTGSLDNIGKIPESFKEKMADIKKNPGSFIADQLLGMALAPIEEPVRNFIDEHDERLLGE